MLAIKVNHCEVLRACDNIIAVQTLGLPMGSVTNVLNNESLQAALQDKKLQSALYQELRIIARAKLRNQMGNDELNTTALVHEAFLKLNASSDEKKWSNRRHFFSTAALAMRHILVDVARRRLAEKRGLAPSQVTMENLTIETENDCLQMVALNEALEQLSSVDSRLVEVVNLRYFVGMTVAETAEVLGVSKRTLDREWLKAKAMLMTWMEE
jgi:RNA polymerase sigma factor (TIGR02999 family)